MAERQTRAGRRAAQERAQRRRAAYQEAQQQESLLDWEPTTGQAPAPAPAPAAPDNQAAPERPVAPGGAPQPERAVRPLQQAGSAPAQRPQLQAPSRPALQAPGESLLERRIRQSEEVKKPLVAPSTMFFAGSIVALLSYCAALGLGGPVLGHSLDWRYLAGGVVLLLTGGFLAWRYHPAVSFGKGALTGIVALVIAAAFTVGSVTSVVIDGKVYASTSRTAEAYRLSTDMYKDLQYMASVDPMLDAAQAQARSEYASYNPAAERLDEVSKKWAEIASDPGSLPSPAFVEVANHTANAADWASKAMKRKGEIILQPDARGEADVNSYRATFQQELLTAGPQLSEVAGLYGISIENGPKE